MRAPLAVVAAAATAAGVVIAVPGGAGAVTLPSPSLSPLPSISVGLPTVSTTPLPLPSTSLTDDPGDTVGDVTDPLTGGGGSGGDDSGSGADSGSTGTTPGTTTGTSGTGTTSGTSKNKPLTKREQRAQDSTPMVAGTAAARDLVDDEHSPEMRAAGQAFLDADQAIAEIARQKQVMAGLKQDAVEQAKVYQALDTDVTNAEPSRPTSTRGGTRCTTRWCRTRAPPTSPASPPLTTRRPSACSTPSAGCATRRPAPTCVSARCRCSARSRVPTSSGSPTATTRSRTRSRPPTSGSTRSPPSGPRHSQAVQAAKAGDVALNQARIAESGDLGAQIEAASTQLQRDGETVQGTGRFGQPAAGVITSPYGMRYHPILHYRKLHTGTDFAGGGSAVRAADDGRVIMTVVSEAYGNFTVIDHGVIGGDRITTAYAHQSQFLVREGQRVEKGQQIGVIGSTGYSTGPHLHFEVRQDGVVVDPLAWLTR